MKIGCFFVMFLLGCGALAGSAMAEEETAAQWAEREKGALVAAVDETSLAQTLKAGAPALAALFSEIKTDGASDALASTRIAALTQYVMRPGREAVRRTYADALLAAARRAKDADVICFFIDQLRWCGLSRQADDIRALKSSSATGVADFAEMAAQMVVSDRVLTPHAPAAETRCAALNKELAGLSPSALTPRLLQAVDDADPAYAGVALSWASAAGGPKETRLWIEKMKATGDPLRKAMLLDMLAARRDAAAAQAVAACLCDADAGVAAAAQRALIVLNVPLFAERLSVLLGSLPAERLAGVRETVRTLPNACLEQALVNGFGQFNDAGKRLALEVLRERRSDRALSVGLAAIREKNEEVVIAGYRLLREAAGPEQAPMLVARLQTADGRVLAEAEHAMVAAARRDVGGAYVRALNDALASAADARKPPLLETAARVGGDALRTGVEKAAESPNGEVATAAELRVDEAFFKTTGGGVTFSGGEPLRQIDFLEELAARLKPIHLAIETSGYASPDVYRRAVRAVDEVFQDLKHPEPVAHKQYTGVELQPILENIAWLKTCGRPFTIRIPLIPGVNDTPERLARFAELIQDGPETMRVELLPYHAAAGAKYPLVGRVYRPPFDPACAKMPDLRIFTSRGLRCRVL